MIRCSSLKKSCCCFAAMWNYQEDADLRKKKTTFFSKRVQWNSHECGQQGIHFKHACISFGGEKCITKPWNLKRMNDFYYCFVICLIIHLFCVFFFSLCTVCFRRRKKKTLTFRWFHHDLSEFLAVHPVHLLSMWSILIFVHEQSNLAFSCSISAQYRCLASRNVVNPFIKSPPLLPSLSKRLLCIACSDFRAFV